MKTEIEERNGKIASEYLMLTDKRGVQKSMSPDDVIEQLANQYDIGKFYVRSILRAAGVSIDRKGKYDRKYDLSDRDRQIIELAEKGDTPEKIGELFEITPTRVRQVVRDNVTNMKMVLIERTLSDMKDDVNKDVEVEMEVEKIVDGEKVKSMEKFIRPTPYKDIVAKYGAKAIRDVKSNLGYNLFRACQKRRDEDIVKMGKAGFPASWVKAKWGLCNDYIYGIWHEHGIHKDTKAKLTDEEREARNEEIYQACLARKIGPVSKEYKLSYTMVKIIFNQQKEKHEK